MLATLNAPTQLTAIPEIVPCTLQSVTVPTSPHLLVSIIVCPLQAFEFVTQGLKFMSIEAFSIIELEQK